MPADNILHIYASEGKRDLVVGQITTGLIDINAKGADGSTALNYSACIGHTDVVKALLSYDVDVNIPDVSSLKLKKFILLVLFHPIFVLA